MCSPSSNCKQRFSHQPLPQPGPHRLQFEVGGAARRWPILRLRWLGAPADRRMQPAWQERSLAANEPEVDVMLVMQGSPVAPLPVVLSPLPAAAAASLGWAAWDEVLTIRRHPETARPDPGAFSSWDELLGCR